MQDKGTGVPTTPALPRGACDLPEILKAEDIAAALGVGLSGARRIIAREFPHVRMGKRVIVLREAFLKVLRDRTIQPSAPSIPVASPSRAAEIMALLKRPVLMRDQISKNSSTGASDVEGRDAQKG